MPLNYSTLFLQSEEKDGIVKLKDSQGKSLKFPIEKHDTLIVRKADRHLWTLFSKAMLDGESINKVVYNGMVVLGPEGIGKTWCSMYFLIMAIKKGYTTPQQVLGVQQEWKSCSFKKKDQRSR